MTKTTTATASPLNERTALRARIDGWATLTEHMLDHLRVDLQRLHQGSDPAEQPEIHGTLAAAQTLSRAAAKLRDRARKLPWTTREA